MSMFRLGIETRSLSTEGGGVRRYTVELLRHLLRLHTHYDIHTYTDAEKNRGTFLPAHEHVVPLAHPLLRLWWDTIQLPHALKRDGIQGVHYTKPATSPFLHLPSIATIHDIIPLLFPEVQTLVQYRYWKYQLPRTIRHCTHLLTVSEASKRDIIERFHIPPEHITVTPLGVDHRFAPLSEEKKQHTQHVYTHGVPYIAFLGTIDPRKNIATLLRAFKRLLSHIPHHLLIAGKWGWKYNDVKALLHEPALAARVHHFPHLPTEELPSFLGAADVFVFPSLYEGFGLPPLEAMACGTPVITSNRSSLPEAVGSHAVLLENPQDPEELANALEALLNDSARRKTLSAEGRAWAQTFTWQRTAEQTLAVYKTVFQ